MSNSRRVIQLFDANISGSIFFEATREELTAIVEGAGTWQTLPNTSGVVLLDAPHGYVYRGATAAELENWEEYTDAPAPTGSFETVDDKIVFN